MGLRQSLRQLIHGLDDRKPRRHSRRRCRRYRLRLDDAGGRAALPGSSSSEGLWLAVAASVANECLRLTLGANVFAGQPILRFGRLCVVRSHENRCKQWAGGDTRRLGGLHAQEAQRGRRRRRQRRRRLCEPRQEGHVRWHGEQSLAPPSWGYVMLIGVVGAEGWALFLHAGSCRGTRCNRRCWVDTDAGASRSTSMRLAHTRKQARRSGV
mmetsp:Transcript_93213/g.301421  ORF Transcript_93213/g.301421 Transcript_93213/m.301421 type:complete len:211 (-) Transcript_93213:6-638(-)